MKIRIILILLVSTINYQIIAQDQKWAIQEGYEVSFSGNGADGSFNGLTGEIVFDDNNLDKSYFNVSIEPSSISTGNKTKNKHARGDSWLDVKKYTTIEFKSEKITKRESDYQVSGDLKLHGVTKKADITFKFEVNGGNGVFTGDFTVNREEFDVMGPFFSFVVGEDFKINLKVPVKLIDD